MFKIDTKFPGFSLEVYDPEKEKVERIKKRRL